MNNRDRLGVARLGKARAALGSQRDQKWGGRYLISDDAALNNTGTPRRVTILNTGDLGIPTPINVQLRFALNIAANRQPALPFVYPCHGGISLVRVTVRRGVDETSGMTTDIYNLSVNDVLPIDIITARLLQVEVEVTGFGSGSTTWVEAIATPVSEIGPINQVHPWSVPRNPAFIATTAAETTLLAANSDRGQFFIVNTSTDADLMVQLGKGPNGLGPTWGPPPRGTYVLPRNMFAVYESPTPAGYKGTVFGIWSGAGTGGALIHEGTVF
jgi:hypothetical protein